MEEAANPSMWTGLGTTGVAIIAALFAMSVAAGTIAWRKWSVFRRSFQATRAFRRTFRSALDRNDVPGALAAAGRHRDSHVARVLGQAMAEVAPALEDRRSSRGELMEMAERTIEREQILLAVELKKGLGLLATVGATAPLLGLLGTVTGIMASFAALARTQGGGVEAVASGIGEALLTTAVGLVVAIPCVWLFNSFQNQLEEIFSELAYAGREFVEWIGQPRHRETEDADARPQVDTGPSPIPTTPPAPVPPRHAHAEARTHREPAPHGSSDGVPQLS